MQQNKRVTQDQAMTLATLVCLAAFQYGMRVLLLCVIAAAVSMTVNLIVLYVRRILFRLKDLDAAVTGIVLTMMLPPTIGLVPLIAGCVIGSVIGGILTGLLKEAPLSPAAIGYAFLWAWHPDQIRMLPDTLGSVPLGGLSSANMMEDISLRWNAYGLLRGNWLDWCLGDVGFPMSSLSLLLLVVIGVVLLCRRSASASVTVSMLTVILACSALIRMRNTLPNALAYSMLTNQTLFAILYCHSVPCYAPKGIYGIAYGVLAGTLVMLCTRVYPILRAPILLVVLLSPVAWLLRYAERRRPQLEPEMETA